MSNLNCSRRWPVSLQMKKHSKAIGCNREFSDGTLCGKPVVAVFGAYPEFCTSCACKGMATKDGFAAAEQIIEQHYGRLRALVIAASVTKNPWAIKNAKERFVLLDKLCADLGTRRLMNRISVAQRLGSKDSNAGKLVNELRRVSLGSMWRSVPVERAIELRKGGFETRFIGVAWQVKVS